MLTGQLADKPTRGQSSRGLDNSQTSQLADGEFLKNHGITILYLYIEPNPNHNCNPIEYWQRLNSVICLKQHLELLYTPNYKSNISATWLDLSASCPVTDPTTLSSLGPQKT